MICYFYNYIHTLVWLFIIRISYDYNNCGTYNHYIMKFM